MRRRVLDGGEEPEDSGADESPAAVSTPDQVLTAPGILAALLMKHFDQDSIPRILVEQDLTVLLINEAARAIIAKNDAIVVSEGKIRLRSNQEQAELEAFIGLSGRRVRNLVLKRNQRPETLIQPRRVDVEDRTFFALDLRRFGGRRPNRISGLARHFKLTQTEYRILLEMTSGRDLREIAKLQRCSYETVRTHVRNIYRKMEVNSRAQLGHVVDAFSV